MKQMTLHELLEEASNVLGETSAKFFLENHEITFVRLVPKKEEEKDDGNS